MSLSVLEMQRMIARLLRSKIYNIQDNDSYLCFELFYGLFIIQIRSAEMIPSELELIPSM